MNEVIPIILAGGTGDYLDEDDIIRFDDIYGRANKS